MDLEPLHRTPGLQEKRHVGPKRARTAVRTIADQVIAQPSAVKNSPRRTSEQQRVSWRVADSPVLLS